MGKNSGTSWLNAVRKAFRSPVKDDDKITNKRREVNYEQEEDEKFVQKRGKKRWIFGRHFPFETTIQHNIANCANSSAVSVCSGEETLMRKQPKLENRMALEQRSRAIAEAAVATAQAAVEVIRVTKPFLMLKKHKAAVVIQTFFRAYLARRALLALKGVVKLQALIRGHNVRKRAKMTLQCIQSLVRVQALVCDQRRRLSCDATTLGSPKNTGRNSTSRNMRRTSNNFDVNQTEVEKIHALIQKAKQCSLKQGKTLAHALSQQIWTADEDQFSENCTEEDQYSDSKRIHPGFRRDVNLCNQRGPIKTVEVDTSTPCSYKTQDQYLDSMFIPSPLYGKRLSLSVLSPKSPSSSSKMKSICSSPYHETGERKYPTAETPTSRAIYLHRMSMSENSCPLPQPNYMAATASAMARVRPHSTPRLRPWSPSPSREHMVLAKKRLSFPIHDEQRTNKPDYGTE